LVARCELLAGEGLALLLTPKSEEQRIVGAKLSGIETGVDTVVFIHLDHIDETALHEAMLIERLHHDALELTVLDQFQHAVVDTVEPGALAVGDRDCGLGRGVDPRRNQIAIRDLGQLDEGVADHGVDDATVELGDGGHDLVEVGHTDEPKLSIIDDAQVAADAWHDQGLSQVDANLSAAAIEEHGLPVVGCDDVGDGLGGKVVTAVVLLANGEQHTDGLHVLFAEVLVLDLRQQRIAALHRVEGPGDPHIVRTDVLERARQNNGLVCRVVAHVAAIGRSEVVIDELHRSGLVEVDPLHPEGGKESDEGQCRVDLVHCVLSLELRGH